MKRFRKNLGMWIFISVIVFIMAMTIEGREAGAADVFKIGVIAPMTGPAAETGEGMKGASIIAAEEINKKGGILGRKIELYFGDDESKAAAGASVMERLINREKVDIIIGTMNSNVGLATMEIAANYRIPFIMTGPAAQTIADKIKENPARYKYLLKPDPSTANHTIGVAGAAEMFAKEDPVHTNKKTAVFVTEHTDWGKGLAVVAEVEMGKVGWKVIDKQEHDIGETNFMSLLSKIKALNPDLLATAETSASAGSSLAKQFLDQGLKMYLVQVYAPFKPGYLEALGGGVDGLMGESMVECHTKLCDEFTKKYINRFGAPKFDVVGAMQYDMMHAAANAYEKVGSFDKDKWIQAMLDMRTEGTIGVYVFNKDNHEAKVGKDYLPTVVKQLQGKKWEFMKPDYMRTKKFIVPSWLK
jgi:branched-chain amino acid transport system substrate-binding protein